mmetsp:Transcript_50162/g.117818  ORF Transcript_50162/g.117818 Transcript_50162/m.117818 type:complete len:398 (-) Transcript_50162:62-1255(-)
MSLNCVVVDGRGRALPFIEPKQTLGVIRSLPTELAWNNAHRQQLDSRGGPYMSKLMRLGYSDQNLDNTSENPRARKVLQSPSDVKEVIGHAFMRSADRTKRSRLEKLGGKDFIRRNVQSLRNYERDTSLMMRSASGASGAASALGPVPPSPAVRPLTTAVSPRHSMLRVKTPEVAVALAPEHSAVASSVAAWFRKPEDCDADEAAKQRLRLGVEYLNRYQRAMTAAPGVVRASKLTPASHPIENEAVSQHPGVTVADEDQNQDVDKDGDTQTLTGAAAVSDPDHSISSLFVASQLRNHAASLARPSPRRLPTRAPLQPAVELPQRPQGYTAAELEAYSMLYEHPTNSAWQLATLGCTWVSPRWSDRSRASESEWRDLRASPRRTRYSRSLRGNQTAR